MRSSLVLVLCAVCASGARADDGGIRGVAVNGDRVKCPALLDGGPALCFGFNNGAAAAARKAIKLAPLAEGWKKALDDTAAALLKMEARARDAEGLAKKNEDRAVSATKSADASKERADKLQKSLDGSWVWTVIKYALPATALGAGFLLGRYLFR